MARYNAKEEVKYKRRYLDKNMHQQKTSKRNKYGKADKSKSRHSKSINRNGIINTIQEEIVQILITEQIYCKVDQLIIEIQNSNINECFLRMAESKNPLSELFIPVKGNGFISLAQKVEELVNTNVINAFFKESNPHESDSMLLCDYEINAAMDTINLYFNKAMITEILSKNNRIKDFDIMMSRSTLIKEIPDDITELFPEARKMKRHFILHIGDTNTGKTYDAVEDYMHAERGVYLAPLRLLALEIQEKLNDRGILCSLLTGEEEDIIPEAKHMSSTVEMLNIQNDYDVCVIDEVQLIQDNERGWAWTTAILGVKASRIHLCMSENARKIMIKLIECCNDTYEIIEHKRNTQLIFEESKFEFPSGIRKHDALVVFSRKKVLNVAAELRSRNMNVSVVYGALPYSVRKEEMRKFMDGESDVLVCTDVLGLGCNALVHRVVFLESSKYDGKENRYLLGPEVKQIAGRAGRRGMFDEGYVNALIDKNMLQKRFDEPYTDIEYARIQMPKRILELDMSLSEIIEHWSNIPDAGIFRKTETERNLELCKYLEANFNLSKQEMLRFIMVPFDENNSALEDLWKLLVSRYVSGDSIEIDLEYNLSGSDELKDLETNYKKLDLYFSFARAIDYNDDNFRQRIVLRKEEIAIDIMDKLENVDSEIKRCPQCQTEMPWNYPYRTCNDCFHKSERCVQYKTMSTNRAKESNSYRNSNPSYYKNKTNRKNRKYGSKSTHTSKRRINKK